MFAVTLPAAFASIGNIAPLQSGVAPLHTVVSSHKLDQSSRITTFSYRITVDPIASPALVQSLQFVYFGICSPVLQNTVPLHSNATWTRLSADSTVANANLDDTRWTGFRQAVNVTDVIGASFDSAFNVTGPFTVAPISVILRFNSHTFYVATVLGPVKSTCTGIQALRCLFVSSLIYLPHCSSNNFCSAADVFINAGVHVQLAVATAL